MTPEAAVDIATRTTARTDRATLLTGAPNGEVGNALAQLEHLLEAAADTPLDDPSWQRLRDDAGRAMVVLIAAGLLPAHLQVGATDVPAVTARVIAVAWRTIRRYPERTTVRTATDASRGDACRPTGIPDGSLGGRDASSLHA